MTRPLETGEGRVHFASLHTRSAVGEVSPHDEWRGNKRQKEALRAKFGGRCAYCGCELTAMHCDHLEPVVRLHTDPWGRPLPAAEKRFLKPERNVVGNMMPACGPCNLHKGGHSLENWRSLLQRAGDIIRKQTSTFKAGERFGVITVSDAPVVFYFEKLGGTACTDPDHDLYPHYGVAPHECFYKKGPAFKVGESTLIPMSEWPDNFVVELEAGETLETIQYPSACGVYYCPTCKAGMPSASASTCGTQPGTGEVSSTPSPDQPQ